MKTSDRKSSKSHLEKNYILLSEYSPHIVYVHQILSLQTHKIPASAHSEIPVLGQKPIQEPDKMLKLKTNIIRT